MTTPAYVIDLAALDANARQLAQVAQEADCTIIMALKAFSCPQTFPTIAAHLPGVCASGPYEARLGREEFGGLVVTCSPAYTDADIKELLEITDILDFNSLSQWQRFSPQVKAHPRFQNGQLRCGLRINPECSTQHGNPLYDPCAPGSRLGTPLALLEAAPAEAFQGLHGLHFHTLCEQSAEDLATTLSSLEKNFAPYLSAPWCQSVNFGGGHWITKPDYDRPRLIQLIKDFQKKWQVKVILEPGEAVVIHTGTLVSSVLDIMDTGEIQVALLDISATAHMPDTLEMPYRPDILLPNGTLAGMPEKHPHSYRLGGPTCLAGDIIGDYSFPQPLQIGDQLIFDDMAHYTMVKTTMFNGVPHPDIVLRHPDGTLETVRQFSYQDFRSRMG